MPQFDRDVLAELREHMKSAESKPASNPIANLEEYYAPDGEYWKSINSKS